jgi:acetyl esterase
VHLHGGAMVFNQAAQPKYARWRQEMAAVGLIVLGVEFRNGAGKLGPHPYPAGLNDCESGLRWALDHMDGLGVSHVILAG